MSLDPKIVLHGDKVAAGQAIRAARILLDGQMRKDIALGTPVSKVRYVLPTGQIVVATHEYSQTYLDISASSPGAPHAAQNPGVPGSSGLYLMGVDKQGNIQEYLVSHFKPYITLLSTNGTPVYAPPGVAYPYPYLPTKVFRPFSDAAFTTYPTAPLLKCYLTKTVAYLPSGTADVVMGGARYKLVGYAPTSVRFVSYSAIILWRSLPKGVSPAVPDGNWTGVMVDSQAYLNNTKGGFPYAYFPPAAEQTAQPLIFYDNPGGPFYNAATAVVSPDNAVAPPGTGTLPNYGYFGPTIDLPYWMGSTGGTTPTAIPYGVPGVSAVCDGNGVATGFVSTWATSAAKGAQWPNYWTYTASAQVYTFSIPNGGYDLSLQNGGVSSAISTTLNFTWQEYKDQSTNVIYTTCWGDFIWTATSYATVEKGRIVPHLVSSRATAAQPSETGVSMTSFESTVSDSAAAGSVVAPGMVLFALTSSPRDFIVGVLENPGAVSAATANLGPDLGALPWIFSFRDWSSPSITPNLVSPNYLSIGACADVSPMGEVFFAASDLSYVVHEPTGPFPMLQLSKGILQSMFVRLLACIWL